MLAWHPANQSANQSAGQSGGQVDEVPDPYYGGMDGFVHMYELLEQATSGLMKDIEARSRQEH